MISRKYKITFDVANCLMIYLLGLACALGFYSTLTNMGSEMVNGLPWVFMILSAFIIAGFVTMRLLITQYIVSIVAHVVVCAVVLYLPIPSFDKILLAVIAILLTVLDINDFYKKKNQGYGVIHYITCGVFVIAYVLADICAGKLSDANHPKAGQISVCATAICLLCIVYFALILLRSYVANAIHLADNSQIDENAPVNYMYGNSNKFIGPIIALIVAIMLVIQSALSVNIFQQAWLGLLGGVAGICNLFSFLGSDQTSFETGTNIAATGSTLYIVEVCIAAIIVIAIIVALAFIATKIYKNHWRKDFSADETLETAAMVEKREWIYHKESKKAVVVEDTSVTKAAEIPVEIPEMVEEEVAEVVEETVEEVAEATEEVENPKSNKKK